MMVRSAFGHRDVRDVQFQHRRAWIVAVHSPTMQVAPLLGPTSDTYVTTGHSFIQGFIQATSWSQGRSLLHLQVDCSFLLPSRRIRLGEEPHEKSLLTVESSTSHPKHFTKRRQSSRLTILHVEKAVFQLGVFSQEALTGPCWWQP